MSKNTIKKSTSTKKIPSLNMKVNLAFLQDKRLHIASGLFLLISSVFLLLAFIAYLFTGKADQSVVLSLNFGDLILSGKEVENWVGLFGAWVSHLFIFKWFGIASFLLIPICFLYGYELVYSKKVENLSVLTKVSFFFMFWITLVMGYLVFAADKQSNLQFLCGGIGYEVSSALDSLAGWGTLLLLLFALGIFVIYFFNITSLASWVAKAKSALVEDDHIVVSTHMDEEDEIEDDEEPIHESIVATVASASKAPLAEELKVPEAITPPSIPTIEEKEIPHTSEAITPPVVEELVNTLQKEAVPEETEVVEEVLSTEIQTTSVVEEETGLALKVEETKEEEVVDKEVTNYDPTLDLARYKYPTLDLLEDRQKNKVNVTREELEVNKDSIIDTLRNYKIGISSIKATIGPTVTLYEIVPEPGVKISKIKNLEDDIALSLAALGIRIIAPIPGRGTVGIEVPNKKREMVSIRSVFSNPKFLDSEMDLPIAFGKNISNELFLIDLAKMPHILIAGATGQGKSVGINVLLNSLLYKKHPSQLKFVLVDPKKVELSLYNKIRNHFLAKLPDSDDAIITDTKKVINTLNSVCIEMDKRYDLLKEAHCRNLKEYNKKFIERRLNPQKGHRFMPYIVVIIDELADLMMTAGKEVETPISRLAQLARAIGIHLVVATQRPSVNVITGLIKANFPARLSFKVTSKIDSRTILDAGGADQLIGHGDMLFSQGSETIRVQCAFIDTDEAERVCDFIGEQQGYGSPMPLPEYLDDTKEPGKVDLSDKDSMFEEAARLVVLHQQGSTSLVQRKLKLGYNRAGRLIDQLEAAGVVGPFEGSKAREVLVKDEMSLEQLLKSI
ncbi:MAG: DNA translocase FtsK 4TM domain-containing protein [Cyclobacteriaceae bacterium]